MKTPTKKVMIHLITHSMTNLEDSLNHYKPDYVFLLSPGFYGKEKASLAVIDIKEGNSQTLGKHVDDIEYVELIEIEDAWHKTTMENVYEVLGDIKEKSNERARAAGTSCEFYAGLADAPGLMSVGVAFASVMHGMSTYFTRGRRPYYEKEYVLDIENLNKITTINSWLNGKEVRRRNLRYLKEIIRLEDEGNEEIFSITIAESENIPFTQKAVDNALRVLEGKDLINIEGERYRLISSTSLGRLTIKTLESPK